MIFTSLDVIDDMAEGLPARHWVHELIIVISASLFIIYNIVMALKREKKLEEYKKAAGRANLEVDYYKKKVQALKWGVSEIIDEQFKIWGLSRSERDVALLLVKGMSMKEIAKARETSEATVRQQSTSVYKKSNLENRNQLTSYFLEDLF